MQKFLDWFNSLNSLYKYGLIGIVVLVLLAIIILVVVIIIKNSSKTYKKKLDKLYALLELSNKNQIIAYIKKLENIYKLNSDLEDMFIELNGRFNQLTGENKDNLTVSYNDLSNKLANVKSVKKDLANEFLSFENNVKLYLEEASSIENKFVSFYKIEDDLRIKISDIKNRYKEVNSDISNYSSSLSLCLEQLNQYMGIIEVKFSDYDDLLAKAKYQEVEKLYNVIDKMVLNVYGQIERIATYCKMINEVIPSKLEQLVYKYNDLNEKGYVVVFANVNEFVSNTNRILKQCEEDFKNLSFGDFEEIANEFENKLTEVNFKLDNEVNSKHNLEGKYQIVIEQVNKAETEFIKTKRQFYTLKNYYKLPSTLDDKFSIFEKNATLLSSLKIEYDGFIFTNANRPASFMLEKLNVINDLCIQVNGDIAFFANYFNSIRNYVEDIYKKVYELSTNLIKAMGEVRKANCKDVYYRYIEKETQALNDLKNISDLLVAKPIDIETLQAVFNVNVNKIEELQTSLVNDLANYKTVQKSIIFANPLRHQFKEVDTLLSDVENSFKQGKYKDSQEKLNYILNNYHPVAFDSFKE